jgi:hypothetical protein
MRFGLVLMGRAIEYLPYVIFAVSEMARRGLGADRASFELLEVVALDLIEGARTIYCGESRRMTTSADGGCKLSDLIGSRLAQLAAEVNGQGELGRTSLKPGRAPAEEVAGSVLRLHFVTPTRIRVEGDLQAGLSFELLVRNLLRRVSLLAAVHGCAPLRLDFRGLIERARQVETVKSRLSWWDWERYSNRQQTKMKLGGFVGEIEYAGDAIVEYLPLLVAGETLHVGGSTAFGLGKYEVDW